MTILCNNNTNNDVQSLQFIKVAPLLASFEPSRCCWHLSESVHDCSYVSSSLNWGLFSSPQNSTAPF